MCMCLTEKKRLMKKNLYYSLKVEKEALTSNES